MIAEKNNSFAIKNSQKLYKIYKKQFADSANCFLLKLETPEEGGVSLNKEIYREKCCRYGR